MTATTMMVEEFKVTELGPLPQEWEVAKIGDVAGVTSGGSAPQGKEFFGGGNPFIRVQHLELESNTIRRWDLITDRAINKCGLRLYSKGTIVFPKSGASIYLEKRAILPIDAYIVGHLCAVISQSPLVDQNFLFYYLRFVRLSEQKAEGYPTLNLTEIRERRIACPPLSEQKSIAYFLSTVQTAIEKTEAVIKAARELKKSLMKHLFTYGPVTIDEAKNVPLKETEIGMVPEGWEVEPFDKSRIRGKAKTPPSIPLREYQTRGKYPIIDQSANYIAGYTNDYNRVLREQLPVIIFGDHTRVFKFVGFPFAIGADGTKIIYPNLSAYNPKFLYYYLMSLDIPSRGYNRHFRILREQKIACPPLPEQKEIADAISVVDTKIEAEENKRETLEALFKTLLSRLMTGKIRVNNLGVSV